MIVQFFKNVGCDQIKSDNTEKFVALLDVIIHDYSYATVAGKDP